MRPPFPAISGPAGMGCNPARRAIGSVHDACLTGCASDEGAILCRLPAVSVGRVCRRGQDISVRVPDAPARERISGLSHPGGGSRTDCVRNGRARRGARRMGARPERVCPLFRAHDVSRHPEIPRLRRGHQPDRGGAQRIDQHRCHTVLPGGGARQPRADRRSRIRPLHESRLQRGAVPNRSGRHPGGIQPGARQPLPVPGGKGAGYRLRPPYLQAPDDRLRAGCAAHARRIPIQPRFLPAILPAGKLRPAAGWRFRFRRGGASDPQVLRPVETGLRAAADPGRTAAEGAPGSDRGVSRADAAHPVGELQRACLERHRQACGGLRSAWGSGLRTEFGDLPQAGRQGAESADARGRFHLEPGPQPAFDNEHGQRP